MGMDAMDAFWKIWSGFGYLLDKKTPFQNVVLTTEAGFFRPKNAISKCRSDYRGRIFSTKKTPFQNVVRTTEPDFFRPKNAISKCRSDYTAGPKMPRPIFAGPKMPRPIFARQKWPPEPDCLGKSVKKCAQLHKNGKT